MLAFLIAKVGVWKREKRKSGKSKEERRNESLIAFALELGKKSLLLSFTCAKLCM